MPVAKTNDEYCNELKDKNINAQPLETYVGAKTKIKHLCLKHNVPFYSTPSNLLNRTFSCPLCKKEKKELVAQKLRFSQQEYENKVSSINPYIKIQSKYKSVNNKITYKCSNCGFEDEVSAGNLLIKRECVNCGCRPNAIDDKKYQEILFSKFPHITYNGKLKNLNSKLDFYCNIHDYSWITTARITRDFGCPVCNGKTRSNKSYIDELKNKNSYVYPIEPIKNAKDKIKHKCCMCQSEFDITPTSILSKIHKKLGLCPICSDGISYPNKFIHSLIYQLSESIEEYKFEYSPTWAKYKLNDGNIHKGYYDAKVITKNNSKIIIEMDGGFHNKDNNMSGQTKELSKNIDAIKDNLAIKHGYKVIRINCDYENNDRFEYIKRKIISNDYISKTFDLSKIDWNLVSLESEKSCFIEVCQYCKDGLSIKEIASQMHLDTSSIRKYLKRGTKLGLCNYNPKEEYEKSFVKMKEKTRKKCICLDTGKRFNSLEEAGKYYDISSSSISLCCNGKRKTAGSHRWSTNEIYFKDISA